MARIEKTVFISYRRKDISWALAVYQYLTSQKYDVFFDFSSIPSGDFEQIIVSNIRARAHFILILTPTALNRADEPGDWLRREIETAIDERRNIIPLFFDGFDFGSPSVAKKLTGKLSAIKRYNGLDIPSGYFMEAMERLRSRYLNIPLNAVIHPVSTEVRKVVKEEQVAANRALEQKKEVIEELVKPADELPEIAYLPEDKKAADSSSPTTGGFRTLEANKAAAKLPNLRRYGIGAGILLAAVVGIAWINSLIQNWGVTATPPPAETSGEAVISTSTSTRTLPTNTVTISPQAPTPELGIGSAQISDKDGMTLLFVQAGEFEMGGEEGEYDERPVHTVTLDGFWIDQTEVTNQMYSLCVAAGACREPADRLAPFHACSYGDSTADNCPVIYVDWNMAKTYCEWADRRMPTEAEWEKAARGTDGRTYPWGEQIDCTYANFGGMPEGGVCAGIAVEVGSYESGQSPYGVYDMAGNVSEWVADWYDESYYSSPPSENPPGPDSGQYRVLRGGSWVSSVYSLRSADRRGEFDPSYTSSSVGFRCAVSESATSTETSIVARKLIRIESSNYVPDLLESWEVNDDSSVWSLELRQDVTMSDGEPFTSFIVEEALSNSKLVKEENAIIERVDDFLIVIRMPVGQNILDSLSELEFSTMQ